MTIRLDSRDKRTEIAPHTELPGRYRLSFGASYAYSPRGVTVASMRSRQICVRIKRGCSTWLRHYVLQLYAEFLLEQRFDRLFGTDVVLVPVPPSCCERALPTWPSHRLALAILDVGLAQVVWPALYRTRTVAKSSLARNQDRPTVLDHYRSLDVSRRKQAPPRIVLVDDVVTKGRTLLAAAFKLQQAFPHTQIGAFAFLRTLSLVSDIERVSDPCQGQISWDGQDARREP